MSRTRTNSPEPSPASISSLLIQGTLYWLTYGLVDYIVCAILPLLKSSRALATPTHWRWNAIVLVSYAAAGALSGVLGYLLIRLLAKSKHENALRLQSHVALYSGAWTLAAAGVIAVFHNTGSFAPFLSAGGLLILAVLAVAAVSESWETGALLLASPWLSAIVLLLPPVIYRHADLARATRLAAGLCSVLAIAAARILWHVLPLPALRPHTTRARLAWISGGIAVSAICTFGVTFGRELRPENAAKQLAGTAKAPNVVLIVMDTVRGDHTSLLGYHRDTTPQLRGLAANATSFQNAFAVSDMTLSTHASMFTGLYPRQHGAYCAGVESDRGRPLRESFDTLAELLSRSGYSTMAAAANSIYLRSEWGLDQGFQYFDLPDPLLVKQYTVGIRDLIRGALRRFIDVRDYEAQFQSADLINRDALNLLTAAETKKSSFFLFVNYMDAHEPYMAKAPFDHRFGTADSAWTSENYMFVKLDFRLKNMKVPKRTVDLLTTLYDNSIAYEDDQIGSLIRTLKERNLYDNSLIIVTADHGEGLGSSRVLSHPGSVYQAHVGIPLIVKYPHQQEGAVMEQAVSQIDLLPTILAAAGVKPPANLPGVDLHQIDQTASRNLLSVSYPCLASTVPSLNRTTTSVISGQMKYIESTNGNQELYDLRRDPMESVNLIGTHSPEQLLLSTSLERMRRTLVPDRRATAQENTDGMRRLRGLGYVQ